MSVAAQSLTSGPARIRAERWTAALNALFALVIVAATAEIVIDAAAGHTGLVPEIAVDRAVALAAGRRCSATARS